MLDLYKKLICWIRMYNVAEFHSGTTYVLIVWDQGGQNLKITSPRERSWRRNSKTWVRWKGSQVEVAAQRRTPSPGFSRIMMRTSSLPLVERFSHELDVEALTVVQKRRVILWARRSIPRRPSGVWMTEQKMKSHIKEAKKS